MQNELTLFKQLLDLFRSDKLVPLVSASRYYVENVFGTENGQQVGSVRSIDGRDEGKAMVLEE